MQNEIHGREIFQATESVAEGEDLWITLLKEGTSVNNRNYKRPALEKAVHDRVYENIRMFVDHSEKPPLKRSVMELVSSISETKLDTSFPDGLARVRGKLHWIDSAFQERAQKAQNHMGVSHDAKLFGSRSRVNGRKYEDIDEIKQVHSVDWVVFPSAGGGFEEFYGREGVEVADIDWDAVDEEMLKKHKPDLYQELIARAKEGTEDDDDEDEDEDEDGDSSKESVKSTSKKVAALTEDDVKRIVIDALEGVESKKSTQKEVASKIADLVNRSTLPPLTKNRVIASFDGAEKFEEDKVKESIDSAKEELKAVARPRVVGMGPSGDTKQKSTSLGRAHESVMAAFAVGTKKKDSKKDDKEEEEN